MSEKDPQVTQTRAASEPLAIVGIGCLFPKAPGLKSYWANIKSRVDAIGEVPKSHWSAEDYFDKDKSKPDMTYARRGGFLEAVEFDPAEFGVSPNALEATDSAQLLGLVAAGMALKDAGYGAEKEYDRDRVSVILGVTGTLELVVPLGARLGHPIWRKTLLEAGIPADQTEALVERMKDGYVPWQENSFPGLLGNVVAGRIANRFNLGGTNCVVDAACASSLSAAHLASMELQTGRADMVVTGGVDCFNDIFMYMCFSKTPALSPTGDAKPFDKKADGTILGEGLGMLVLKRLADAERDGDRIWAVLRGVGSSSDGRGKSIYAPSAAGQVKALRAAYRNAGVSPATVELVEAHGTGTSVGDGVEVEALAEVYGEAGAPPRTVALGSVKSMIGHTKAAAGSAGLIKAALSLYNKVLPPTIKVDDPLPILEGGKTPFYLNTELRPWPRREHPRRAAVSALGFGGSNFHAVLEEHVATKTATDWDGRAQIVALSGSDEAALQAKLAAWTSPMAWDQVRLDAARSRASFKAADSVRLCLVVEPSTDLPKLAAAAAKKLSEKSDAWVLPDGAFFGRGPAGKAAILFPGQGSQYVGMLRELVCKFPEAFAVLEGAGRELSGKMYPPPAFKTDQREDQEAALRSTDVAQPALGVAGLAAWRVLSSFGATADMLAGHSYGELAALCAAGAYDETALQALSRRRGELMAAGDGGRGAMLAVVAPLSDVEKLVREEKLDLVVANKNAPSQNVLSGAKDEIERAVKGCEARGLKAVRLPVSAAFHSPLVAGAQKDFAATLEKTSFSEPKLPVYANKTAQVYPSDAKGARSLLASQLASSVEFCALVERMHADGARIFVECGAGNRLTGLVGQILSGKPYAAFSIDASNGKRSGAVDLARALAQLSALGRPVDLSKWEGGEAAVADLAAPKPKRLTVKLTGSNHRSTPAKAKPVKVVASNGDAPRTSNSPATVAPAAQPSFLTDAILALQKMQEQTALMHLKFLEAQEAAQRSLQQLVDAQVSGVALSTPTYPPTRYSSESAPVAQHSPIAAASAPALAVVAAKPAVSGVETVLLSVVAEKTGYPAETLNFDMDLESDLGIDSIKRVEILSALSEKLPGAPKVEPKHIGTLRTLRQIAAHLAQGTRLETSSPSAAPAPAAAPASTVEPVLLSIVAEKTGYPADTLNFDMDLESDLGIDSIKRVEILSALSEKLPGAPKVEPKHIGTLRTLRQIANHLSAGVQLGSEPSSADKSAVPASNVEGVLLSVVAEKTGYPADTLNFDMDLESDLGIDSIKRVEILSALSEKLPGAPKVEPKHIGTLRTLRQIAAYLSQGAAAPAPAAVSTPDPVPSVKPAPVIVERLVLKAVDLDDAREKFVVAKDAPLWLAGDEGVCAELSKELEARGLAPRVVSLENPPAAPARLAGLVIVAPARRLTSGALWSASSESFLKSALGLARAAAAALDGGVFATAARLDGAFGLSGLKSEQDPAFGGLAGLTKTASHEWTKTSCRALDVADSLDPKQAAAAIADELCLRGPLELGVGANGARSTLKALRLEDDGAASAGKLPLSEGDLVVVTGGARGVTAEAAAALASFKPVLALWGRTALKAEEGWLSSCKDEASIKRALLSRPENAGLTPKAAGAWCREILAAREVRAQLERFEKLGARVAYEAVDVRDAAAVGAALSRLQSRFGPVRAVVHGAGVLADKLIAEKSLEASVPVFDTKLAGLRNVLAAIDGAALKALALFSSTTARFGRSGQSDYAMANEALNKAGQLLARRFGGCKVVSINWGPWDGGMVTDSLKPLFAKEGIGLIPLEAGGKFLVDELSSPSRSVEITCLAKPETVEPAKGELALTARLEASLETMPVLSSHVLGGKPVVPFALTLEWLGHAALHANPGLVLAGFDDARVLKGVRLDQAAALELSAGKARKEAGLFSVRAEVRGAGGAPLHAAATVLLASKLEAAPKAVAALPGAAPRDADYESALFHGPELRLITRVLAVTEAGIDVESAAAPSPSRWLRAPLRERWLCEPAALDAAFQAMIVWTVERLGAPSLPTRVGRLRQFAAWPAEGAVIRARVVKAGSGSACADVDFVSRAGSLLARLEGYECAVDASLVAAFRR